MAKAVLGIIGGSGIYDLPGLEKVRQKRIKSPGASRRRRCRSARSPACRWCFSARHDTGHRLSPSDINYRANIDVLKRAGVTDLVSLSACGSFKQELPPGTFVLVDQFVDRTFNRASSFFGKGCVAHVSMAHPVSPRLQDRIAAAAVAESIEIVRGGTYVCMEGPQFSSYAESMTYKGLGYSVIGMTNLPEAKLAREAELCYATLAMVTDFDCWHPDHDAVTVQDIIKVLTANAEQGQAPGRAARPGFSARARAMPDRLGPSARHRPDHRAGGARQEALRKLDAVAGRVLQTAVRQETLADRQAVSIDQVRATLRPIRIGSAECCARPFSLGADATGSGARIASRNDRKSFLNLARRHGAARDRGRDARMHRVGDVADREHAAARGLPVAVDHEIAVPVLFERKLGKPGLVRVRPISEQQQHMIDLDRVAAAEADADPVDRPRRAPRPCAPPALCAIPDDCVLAQPRDQERLRLRRIASA